MSMMPELFWGSETLDHGNHFWDFLTGGLRISEQETNCCEGTIMAKEVVKVLPSTSTPEKSLGFDGLPYELFKSISDLFEHLVASVYSTMGEFSRVRAGVG